MVTNSRILGKQEWDSNGKWDQPTEMPDKCHHDNNWILWHNTFLLHFWVFLLFALKYSNRTQ